MVGPPQHPWKLVGPEHQGGEQQVPAALLALWRALILRASSPGQFAFEIETSLPAQLGTHHSRGGRVCGGGGGGGSGGGGGDGAFTTCCQDITLNLQRAEPKSSPERNCFKVTSAVQHRCEPARRRLPSAHCLTLLVASLALRGAAAHLSQSDRVSPHGRRARVTEESPDSMQISALRNRLFHRTSVATEINDGFVSVVGIRSCNLSLDRREKRGQGCFLKECHSPAAAPELKCHCFYHLCARELNAKCAKFPCGLQRHQ